MNRVKQILTGHTRFCLLDANLVAGYYLPESLKSERARHRIKTIIESIRKGACPEVFLYVPNFCIAEIFSVFARYCWATWDGSVKKNLPGGLDQRKYNSICRKFHQDIHNGVVLQQVELNRYHVLATDLINPVDAHYQYHRHHPGGKRYRKQMMSAADHLIIGMGIHLAKIHSRKNFAILTADHRLANILDRAKSVKPNMAQRLGLVDKAQALGLEYGPDIYPQVFHLGKTRDTDLAEYFGEWPLPQRPMRATKSKELRPADVSLLIKLKKASGVPRDQLPYTEAFEDICEEVERQTGRHIDRHEAWRAIGRVEKRPKRKR